MGTLAEENLSQVTKYEKDVVTNPITEASSEASFMEEGLDKLFREERFLRNESWSRSKWIGCRILQIKDSKTVIECCINKDKRIYEKRLLPTNALSHIKEIRKGKLIVLKISEKPGSFRFDVFDNEGVNLTNLSDFKPSDKWQEIAEMKFDE